MTTFPDGFLWGAATSAYQIEGGIDEDDRGRSNWDAFCEQPGKVHNGDSGAVAVDHRHRYREDVALMASLGLKAYRFSISWPRVQPEGSGAISQSGLDFYKSLVDELLAHDIVPVATLFHWDLPLALEQAGGWPSRDTAYRFGEYAHIAGAALGDRIARWSTVNEPWCSSMLGYAAGVFAPGRTEPDAAVSAAHHLLLGHGLAVDALRATVNAPGSEIGITVNPYPVIPASDSAQDLDAARRVDAVANRLWYDPVLKGTYPQDLLDDFSAVSDLSHIRDGDLEQISHPIDFVGINYYRCHHARYEPGASAEPPASTWPGSPDVGVVDPPGPKTAIGWAVEPLGLTETLLQFRETYGDIPLYVHENGASYSNGPDEDGVVIDPERVVFLDAHFRAAYAAIESGVNLKGFFVWSLLDNFEWAQGYSQRFGIIHVDYETLERTPKASARYCQSVFTTNTLPPAPVDDSPQTPAPGMVQ